MKYEVSMVKQARLSWKALGMPALGVTLATLNKPEKNVAPSTASGGLSQPWAVLPSGEMAKNVL